MHAPVAAGARERVIRGKGSCAGSACGPDHDPTVGRTISLLQPNGSARKADSSLKVQVRVQLEIDRKPGRALTLGLAMSSPTDPRRETALAVGERRYVDRELDLNQRAPRRGGC